jgi:hypothetical protein
MTKARINRAIKHLGLEIWGTRGDGYFYFLDLKTEEQIGESVMVCYLKHLTLEKWVEEAKWAREQEDAGKDFLSGRALAGRFPMKFIEAKFPDE